MFTGAESIVIRRPRAEVYRIAERYPLFATFYRSREILAQSETEQVVKVGSTLWGYPTTWTGRGHKVKNESIEFVQTDGLLKGLVALWKFEEMESSTKVTIAIHFHLAISGIGYGLEWLIGNYKVKPTVRMILLALKEVSETAT
jgi:ribosome-associated toxin RatA of RatAB toxin-antitoxin module